MLHLFKRVYLELDDAIDLNVDRYVISETNGVGMLNDLDNVVYGKLLGYSKTVGDLIGTDKDFDNLLQFLNRLNNDTATYGKIIIYCDKVTYMYLSISWLKIILPNLDIDTAYGIVSSNMFQTKMFGTSKYVPFARSYRLTQEEFYVSQQEFSAVYSSITIDRTLYLSFVNLVKSGLSIEFLLASFWYNGDCNTELKQVANHKLSIGMQVFLTECKTFIIENLLNKQIINQFSPTVDYDLSNLHSVIEDPAFDIWFEPSIWQCALLTQANSNSNIMFANITPSQYDKFVQHTKIWINTYNNTACKPETFPTNVDLEAWASSKAKSLKMCMSGTITNSDLLSLLEQFTVPPEDLVLACDSAQIFEWVDRDKFNKFLVEFVRQAQMANNKSKLFPFTLS
jgi:hypothetical protein